ncbi:MAG: hypothetical protein CM15mP129_01340 [Chloroflexota bacterium]|nr:MAG: hypothetical protein CM15mP129_01340 [Chloroflexota bacterium]
MLLHSKILGESSSEVLILHGFLGSGITGFQLLGNYVKKY